MVYSSSAIWAAQKVQDPFYFLKKQFIWACLGVFSMLFFSRVNYNHLREWVKPVLGLTWLFLLAALLSPPIAGARRWIHLGPFSLQPAEFAKLAMIVYIADYMDRKRSKVESALRGLMIPLGILGVTLGLIALEPDLGTPVLIFAVSLILLFLGGSPVGYLAACFVLALPVIAYQILKYPYRRKRLLAFLSPWNDPQGTGYQLIQSLIAVGSGGWLGKGLGSSQLKLLHLPTPHTDFIFPIICEEMGLIGGAGVLGLFFMFLIRGLKVAKGAPDLFGTLLASGIVFSVTLQALLNIAVSIGLLPTKGLPLPFFSFGGSSILATMTGVGILLNISRQAERRR